MKRNFTFLLMAFLALAGFKSWGQETIEIGDGNNISYHFPFSSYYNYSYNEMLYTADEIRTAGTITSISFYAIETTSETYTLDIYMRNVDKTQFSSTTDFIHSSSEDLVWSGLVSGSQSGWVTFELNTPFAYDGTHSLMIAFDNNSGLYKQWYFKQHIIDLMAIAACDDYSNQDPSNPTGNDLYDRIRPNIKIGITPAGGCPAPTGLAASNVTATDATISWNNNGAESYNLDVNGTVYENVTNPYILDVELSTTYTVKVQAVCGEDETSAWSSGINFTTPDCWDGHTINYTLNDSYGDGWNGAKLTIVDKSNNNTIKTLTVSFGQTESGSLTLCSGTYDFVWHTGSYDDECSFSISENEETLFTCDNASAYTDGEVVYTLGLLEKFAITLTQPEDAAVGTISADYEQAAAGTTVTLSTDFNLGYTLDYFMVDEEPIVGNTFEMPEHDVTVSVAYNTLDMYDITFDPEIDDDIISVSATYNGEPVTEAPAGTVITLSYSNLDEGYTFNYWTLNGAQLTGSTFEMPEEDAKIGVNLTERTRYAVAIDSDVQDYITADPSSDILGGTTVTLTISPATGYVLTELHVLDEGENEQDVTITENSNIRTFIMPESNVTVSAVFSPVYNVSIDMALVGGSISQMSTQGTLTAYPAGTQVFLFANPDEDYSFVEDSFIVIRFDGEIGPTVTYTNMVYSFIMPESNVTVSATFNKTAFAVSQVITPMYSGSFAIDKTAHVGIGETVTLSYFNASPGYYFDFEDVNSLVVKRNDNQETVEVNNYDNIYQFAMPTSDVTVTATFKKLPRYSVFVGDVVNGTIYLYDPYQNILAGDIIYFNVEPETGYTLESITVTPEEGNPFEPTQQYDFYYFTMPSSNVTISATFCELQSYTINYYVNGELDRTMQCYEDHFVNNDGPQTVPTGMTFEGWGFAEIDPYTTEKPAVLGNAEKPTQDYNLYAVFSYTESVQSGETWKKVTSTSELSAGDEIVLVYGNYVMGGLWGTEDYHRSEVSIANNEISNLPSDANVLTLVASGSNWKLQYFESEISNTTTLSYTYSTRDCLSYYGYGNISYDEWTAIESSGVMFYNNTYSKYIGHHPNGNFITVVDRTNTACKAYKKDNPFITNTYYMTSVLADGEVAANTTAKNIIITTGTVTVDNNIVLTMNENGLFRNEDAANFVFEDGAQLIYDGDETVNATMKKNINCNASKASNVNWYTISSPLAAASTEFADVTNLIPNNVTDTDYDLYRLNEAEGIWENARLETGANPAFTTIDKGRGYIYSNTTAADIAFAGEINVADVECNLTIGAANGFNLIGNPFTQNIELANVTGVTLADGFYVLTNQDTWGTKLTESEIKPLQGFLVQATEAGTARISKPTAAPSKGERSEQNTNIEMIVSNSNHRDNAFAMFGEGIGLNKVNHRNAEAPMLYIPQDGEKFAIAFMDENTTVFPLNFKAMTTGKYSISLKPTDDINTLVLIDNMTGEETNMLLEESYSFNGSPADSDGRFTVKLSISHNNGQADSEHFVYQNGSELIINGEGTLQIFDVLGRVVISEEVHGQTVNVGGLNTGAYIVRLTGESVMTQKIVVR